MNTIKQHTISVIIPTRNRPELLRRVLSALQAQVSVFDTIVVVDTSDTLFQKQNKKLIATIFSRTIHYFVLPHASASQARNYGILHSTGAILAFLDDDAVPEPGWIPAIQKAAAVGLFCFRGQCIDASEHVSIVHNFYTFYKELVMRDRKQQWKAYGRVKGYQLVDQIQAGNFFIHREILIQLTPMFDAHLFPFIAEEMDFSLRLRTAGYQILFVPEAKIKHYFLRLGYRSFVLYSAFWYGRAAVIFQKRSQQVLTTLGVFGKTIAHAVQHKKQAIMRTYIHNGYTLFRAKYARTFFYNILFLGICLSYLGFLWLGSVYGNAEYFWRHRQSSVSAL